LPDDATVAFFPAALAIRGQPIFDEAVSRVSFPLQPAGDEIAR